jgi:hypothetical protein
LEISSGLSAILLSHVGGSFRSRPVRVDEPAILSYRVAAALGDWGRILEEHYQFLRACWSR